MFRHPSVTIPLLAILATGSLWAHAPDGKKHLGGRLNGMQHVPPSMTADKGSAIVEVDEASNTVEVLVQLEDAPATSVTLYQGPRGMNGMPIMALTQQNAKTWYGNAVLPQAQVDNVLAEQTYVRVASADPFGSIRAQIIAPPDRVFKVVLAQGAPGFVEGKARYSAVLGGFYAEVTMVGQTSAITSVTLRRGPTTASQELESLDDSGSMWDVGSENWDDDLDPKIGELEDGELWIVVATENNPTGEIAGRVVPCDPPFEKMTSSPDNSQVVPPVTTPASGHVTATMESDGSASYQVTSDTPATTAVVRKGAPGSNGPIVLTLSGGPLEWSGQSGPMTQQEKGDMLAGLYYIETSDGTESTKRMRGQLETIPGATSFGKGCSPADRDPTLTTFDAAVLGEDFDLAGFDKAPGALAALFIGIDLDLLLATVSIPAFDDDCRFLVSPIATTTTTADASGSTSYQLSIPLDPSLYDALFCFQEGAVSGVSVELTNATLTKCK